MTAKPLPSIVLIATMGMELCYLYLGLTLVREHLGLNYAALALIMLLYPLSLIVKLIAASLPGIAGRFAPRSGILTIALVLAVSGAAIWQALDTGYPVNGVILLAIFCALAWWLGSSLVHGEMDYYRISFRFQIGIFFLLIFAGAGTVLPIVIFLVLAVLALARARWVTSLSRSRGMLQTFRSWQVVLGILVVLVPGTFIFLALTPGAVGTIVRWLLVAWTKTTTLLISILTSDFWTTPLVDWQLSCACKVQLPEETPPTPPPPGNPVTLSPIIFWVLSFVAFVAMLFLIRLLIVKLMAPRKTRPPSVTSFQATSMRVNLLVELVTFLKTLAKRLWHLLLSLLRRLRASALSEAVSDEPIASIRTLYRSLLAWAAKHAFERVQSQTPLEYLTMLSQRFPQESNELAVITELYVQARYSRSPITSEELETAREAWQKVQWEDTAESRKQRFNL